MLKLAASILLLITAITAQELTCVESTPPTIEETISFDGNSKVIRDLVVPTVDPYDAASPHPTTDFDLYWFESMIDNVKQYFIASSFGDFIYQPLVLRNADYKPYVLPNAVLYDNKDIKPHLITHQTAVCSLLDIDYNFSELRFREYIKKISNDNIATIEVQLCSMGPLYDCGNARNDYRYLTNDSYLYNGKTISIELKIILNIRGVSPQGIYDVICHEMDHQYLGRNHNSNPASFGLGSFDIMGYTYGFNSQASLLNPVDRDKKNFFTPIEITENRIDEPLEDFQLSGKAWVFDASNLLETYPENAQLKQKFYVTYHKKNSIENPFYEQWPVDPIKGGIMIWHSSGGIENRNYDFYPIDIEAAHGKTDWIKTSNSFYDTGIPNSLTGQDKLEAKETINDKVYGFYADTQNKGDQSVVFSPDGCQDFNFFTNPNSNLYNNSYAEQLAQNIITGFSVKNIRYVSNIEKAYADFKINDFTIDKNVTLSKGKWHINNSITVNAGVTVTIQPGTELVFEKGANITVNGIFNLIGTASQRILLNKSGTNNWGGIRFNAGSSGNVQYCNITNAVNGISAYGTSAITIANNNISNCSNSGIYCYSASPRISYNTIENNGNFGISCNNFSSPVIFRNNITGNNVGAFFNYYSSAWLSEKPANGSCCPGRGYNVITQNATGIIAAYGSNIFLGDRGYGGYNCVHDNTGYEISASYNSGITIKSENTWWNRTAPPYYNSSDFYQYLSTIDYIPAFSGPDPNGCIQLKNSVFFAKDFLNNYEKNITDKEIDAAFYAELEGDYDKAVQMYLSKFNKESKLETKKNILSRIMEIDKNSGRTNINQLFSKDILKKALSNDELSAFIIELENCILLNEGRLEQVIENLKFLKENCIIPGQLNKNTLFNLGFLYTYYMQDEETGKAFFNELKSNYPHDEITNNCLLLLGEINKIPMQKIVNKEIIETIQDEIIPETFSLLGNYPNPFNPATVISYCMPYHSDVNLIVFDVMGKEIKSFEINSQSAGKHSIMWDGKNENGILVSSGMYLYRISIKSLENNEEFVKTAKMLLVK